MVSLIFTGCLTALCTAALLSVTIILLAVMVYFVSAVIRNLVKLHKTTKELDELSDKLSQHE